ncbi:F0F1 ATP synthase subunit B [Aureimonas pseudogalii]|uniref:ATP synthase subunit b n=1 Tax=Aureimonas pseudogalii TaxID=1744844 RepID=A0A7W6EE28_9HYPH|nr:F0F1 ATP synthase subunit B [Aureimonas pseudogalii]MBB3996960.1 F-type H+-transporting ATPase subunit b [Aureimonas pseudogalii]
MFVTAAFAQAETPDAGHGATLMESPVPATGEAIHVPEGSHEEAGFPPMNPEFFASQILWLAISFGVFYYVLSKTILPRIAAILENRRERIAVDLDAAERMRADADEAQAAYEQELASARENSHRIAIEARDGARADADAQRKRIEAELDAKLEAAQAQIADVKARALADVDGIAEDAAETILAELTRLDVSREDVSRAVRSVRS